MRTCSHCGQLTDRATGKTTRAVLRAALSLSEGHTLIVSAPKFPQHFVSRLREFVCDQLDLATYNLLMQEFRSKHNSAVIKFTKAKDVEDILQGYPANTRWVHIDDC